MSQWGSELPPLFLLMVLKRLSGMWRPRAYGAIRATCSTWSSIFDAWCPELVPLRWTAVMADKMAWFQSVTTMNLLDCEEVADISSNLAELRSLPSLHTLTLPASCAERAADAEAVYGLTTLTELSFTETRVDFADEPMVMEEAEWVLDLSRMTTLSSLSLQECVTVKGEQMEAVSTLTGLTHLSLYNCFNVTTAGLRATSKLTSLTCLRLCYNNNVTTEVLRAMSSLTALRALNLSGCSSVTDEGLSTLSSLTALVELDLRYCYSMTAAGKQALRTALPNLTIHE